MKCVKPCYSTSWGDFLSMNSPPILLTRRLALFNGTYLCLIRNTKVKRSSLLV